MHPPKNSLPPFWIDKFLQWRLPEDQFEEVQGDMHELYSQWLQQMGRRKANQMYLFHALTFLRPLPKRKNVFQPKYTLYSQANPFGMIRNYFIISFRNLVRQKNHSFINIGGLAVGMAVAILIGLWMWDELSANQHHQNYNTLYQVKMHQTFDGQRGTQDALPFPIGQELQSKYPDFKAVAMYERSEGNRSLIFNNQKFLKKGLFIGQEAVAMFSLNVLNGDKNPLQELYSIVLTDETAHNIFGNQDPVGKILKLENLVDVKVTAVVAKQPKNATLQFDYLLPWPLQEKMYEWIKHQQTNWGNNDWGVYVQLKDGISPEQTNAKIKDVILAHFLNDANMTKLVKPQVFLHPMAKWRLYSEFTEGKNTGGFIKYVQLFGVFGSFILLIACINFMNLSTARSQKRAKEVGVRKAIGSARKQLIGQFLSESTLIAGMALVLAFGIVLLSLPYFNTLTEKTMTIQFGNPIFWGILLVFTLFTGLLAGSYPALYLSSFNPVQILKGGFRVGKSALLPRKILVIIQFTFSIGLMIGTILIDQQIQHGKNRPIGFAKEGLLSVNSSNELTSHFDALRSELLATGVVSSICKSNSPPTQWWSSNGGWQWKGSTPEDKSAIFTTIATSYDYIKTMGIQLKEGRDFSRDFSTDSSGVILNEAAVKRMGLTHPVGELLKWAGKDRTVVGVIPDIVLEWSPYQRVRPLTIVFEKDKNWVNFVYVRINPDVGSSEAIKKIAPIFNKYNPAYPFDYRFSDSEYEKKFYYEELISNLSAIVCLLAIFIACLGLFGLASFMAEQRTKEMAVRKVLGASLLNLWGLLSKDFVVLVIIASGIATPLAWYLLHNWLGQYEYHTTLSWWIFAASCAGALLITLLTVSYQSMKAALTNPVKALRNE